MSHSSFDNPIAIGPDPVWPRESAIEAALRERCRYLESLLVEHGIDPHPRPVDTSNRCPECKQPTLRVGELCEACAGLDVLPDRIDASETADSTEARQEQDAMSGQEG